MGAARSSDWTNEVEQWVRTRPGRQPATYMAQMDEVERLGRGVEPIRADALAGHGTDEELRLLKVIVPHVALAGLSYFIDKTDVLWFLTVAPPNRYHDRGERRRAIAAWVAHRARG